MEKQKERPINCLHRNSSLLIGQLVNHYSFVFLNDLDNFIKYLNIPLWPPANPNCGNFSSLHYKILLLLYYRLKRITVNLQCFHRNETTDWRRWIEETELPQQIEKITEIINSSMSSIFQLEKTYYSYF